MPIHRRLPKRGFNNIFRKAYVEVNVGRIQSAVDNGKLDNAKPIDAAALGRCWCDQQSKRRCSYPWRRVHSVLK